MAAGIPLVKPHLPPTAITALEATLASGYLAQGAQVELFERRLAAWVGADCSCAANEISGALTLSLYVAGVRPGDEVILSPMVCLATSMPVANLFARPVWCDVDPETGMLDATRLGALVSEKTKAIIVSHWSGDVADLEAVRAISSGAGMALVEDASEAFGAEIRGERLGKNTADFTVYSFGPVRQITCGEGAAIFAPGSEVMRCLRRSRRYGIDAASFRLPNADLNPASDIPVAGFHFAFNDLYAAIGLEQFAHADTLIARYRANGAFFQEALAGVPGVRLLRRRADAVSGYWTYSLRVERRDDLVRKLGEHGIGCQRLHVRNDRYSCFAGARGSEQLPGVEVFDRENLSLPCGWWVGDEDRNRIADCIRAGW
jgi:perosamine synthetase